jgi:hypothetical protein
MVAPAARTRPLGQLQNLPPSFWMRATGLSVAAGAVIALPARLVPNQLFRRMTPTRPLDYVFWIVGSVLLGVLVALPRTGRTEAASLTGGTGTFLAVSCPVCNKIVVALAGVSGAMDVFAPLQPVLGLGAIATMLWSLRNALTSMTTCQIANGRSRRD